MFAGVPLADCAVDRQDQATLQRQTCTMHIVCNKQSDRKPTDQALRWTTPIQPSADEYAQPKAMAAEAPIEPKNGADGLHVNEEAAGMMTGEVANLWYSNVRTRTHLSK